MPVNAKLLGFAGLIPFVSLPIATLLGLISYYQSYLYFIQYSAIILSFFGGIHWYIALTEAKNKHQMYVAMLPSLVAWFGLILLSGEALLTLLSIAYLAIFMYDKYCLVLPKKMVVSYITLRLQLTTVVGPYMG